MTVSHEAMLAKTELVGRLPQEDLSRFAGYVQAHSYVGGQEITKQGDLSTGLFIIVSGSVDVVYNRGKRDEKVIATLGDGDFFGEMALLLERPRSATVVAKVDTECLTLLRWDFKDLAVKSPEVLWRMLESLAERLADADARLEREL